MSQAIINEMRKLRETLNGQQKQIDMLSSRISLLSECLEREYQKKRGPKPQDRAGVVSAYQDPR